MEWLAERMTAADHTVSAIHSDQHPDERKRIMRVNKETHTSTLKGGMHGEV